MSFRHILDKFSNETTVHGLPKAIKSRSKTGRLFWVAACLLAIAVCSVQFVQLLTKYYSYPKKVTIDVVTAHVPFPSISLCNMRNLDTTILNEMNRIFKEQANDSKVMVWDSNTTHPFINEYMKLLSKYYPIFTSRLDVETHIFQGALSRTTIATNINRTYVEQAGVQFEEFIVSCLYGGDMCSKFGKFKQFFDPYYYNCYTYSAEQVGDEDSMLAEGLENGWSAVVLTGSGMLNTNQEVRMMPGTHELHSPQASNEGVRVVLHPPGSHPFPHTEGFDVPPGHSVSFGLRPHETLRIGPPHGNCTGSDGYRLIECQKKCVQKGIVKQCGCKDINSPNNDEIPSHVKYCSDDYDVPQDCEKGVTDKCIENLMTFFNRSKCAREASVSLSKNATLARQCGCFPPCYELGYDVTYSLSKWPAQSFDGEEAYIDIFHNIKYLSRFNNSKDKTKFNYYNHYFREPNRNSFMKDFARLNVYIADSNVIKTKESEDYQTSQLLSDIGGQLGLWIGVSVISLSELLELLLDILSYFTKRHLFKKKKSVKRKRDSRYRRENGIAMNESSASGGAHKPHYYSYKYSGEQHPGQAPLLIMAAPPTPEMA